MSSKNLISLLTRYKYILIGAVVLCAIPFIPMPAYILHVIVLIFFFAYLSTAWNLLGGFAGSLSLGHSMFLGLGSYLTYFLFSTYNIPAWASLVLSGLVGSAAGFAIGYPCFRFGLRGPFFSLATLACAEVLLDLFTAFREFTGGALGLFLPYLGNSPLFFQFDSKIPYYYFIVGLWALSVFLTLKLKSFRFKLVAIREDEDAAAAVGIDVRKCKLMAMSISGFMVGMAGTFYLQYFRYINPAAVFGLTLSIEICLIAIFGGMYEVLGPTIGAIILVPISEYLRITLGGTYAGSHEVIYGLLLILVIIFMPRGIYGYIKRRRH